MSNNHNNQSLPESIADVKSCETLEEFELLLSKLPPAKTVHEVGLRESKRQYLERRPKTVHEAGLRESNRQYLERRPKTVHEVGLRESKRQYLERKEQVKSNQA